MPKMKGSIVGPGGMRRTMRSAGAGAPSSTVVHDCEPRIPSAFQSSLTSTPPPSRVMKPHTARGSAGSVVSMPKVPRSEEHTSELQSRGHLVCRLLLLKKRPDELHDDTSELTGQMESEVEEILEEYDNNDFKPE